jgi:D-alanyl-D-alanine carboxypeptidase
MPLLGGGRMPNRLTKPLLILSLICLLSLLPAWQWIHSQPWKVLGSATSHQAIPALPEFKQTPTPWAIQPGPSIDADNVQATAMVLLNASTGQILAQRQAHVRRPMASLTKIMTAAIVLEFAQPDSLVTIPRAATDKLPADSAMMGVTAGEQYTVTELLYGLLLPSGNDAAQALAIAVAGNQSRFVALMNGKALQLGLKDTHFTNPSGLDGPDHYSSAYDLAVITHYAQSFPLFKTIVATSQKQLAYSSRHKYLDLVNANAFIGMYPGATGIKPGNTGEAGNCLVATAERRGTELLGVLLDTPGRNTNMITLFNSGFASLQP